MRIDIPVTEIESSGIQKSASFQIKASGHAFKILSSSLYSDKVAAIIRELSANAYDSHVAAGKKDVPITLHMPSRREPWFAVTDQGIGLDHEEVISLYTTYFSSTKSQSNDFVGAFGLGSKSPFAYTNSFSITSIKDGKKRVYSAYVSEEFVPQINTMGEHDTTEGNGLTVTVPVKDADVYEFSQKAEQVCYHFDPYPIGLSKSERVVPEFIDSSKHLEVLSFKQDTYGNGHNPVVIQGVVAYRFDIAQVRGKLSHADLMLINNINYNIRVPMGAVEVAASREELSYTPKTIEYLAQTLKAALPELRKHVRVTFDSLTSRVEASDYLRANKMIADAVLCDSNHKFLGRIDRMSHLLEHTATKKNFDVKTFTDGMTIHTKEGSKAWKEVRQEFNEKHVKTWDPTSLQFLMSKTSAEWYLLDEQKYWKAKIGEAHQYNRKHIYVFECTDAAKIAAIEEYLGIKLTKLSDLKYTRKVGITQGVSGVIGFDVTQNIGYGARGGFKYKIGTLADFIGDGKKTTYYVNVRHNTVYFKDGTVEETDKTIDGICNDFIDKKTARIMYVRPGGKAHIQKDWVNIEDMFVKAVEALAPKHRYDTVNQSLKNFCVRLKKDTALFATITNKSLIELVSCLTDDNLIRQGVIYYRWADVYTRITGKTLAVIPSADDIVDKFFEQFPLLSAHSINSSKEYLQHVVKYCNMF